MSFKRKMMSDLPQDFSPNIEKYYKLDIFSLVFGAVAAAAVTVIHHTFRDKKGRFDGVLHGDLTFK